MSPVFPPTPMSAIRRIVRRLTALPSKPPIVAYLALLLVVSAWATGRVEAVGRGILIVGIYSFFDLVLGYIREQKWVLPSSAWISGLILSLVLSPTAPLRAVVLAPVLASGSKQLIRLRRRHIFNPAAFALVALGLLYPQLGVVSWWGAAWGLLPFGLITLSGIVTVIRVKRWRTALAFLSVYLPVSGVLLLSRGGQAEDLGTLVIDGTLAFFTTVMLVEPVTTAYQPAWLRTSFGAAVAIFVVLLSLPGVAVPVPDPFLVSLLAGNFSMLLLSRVLRPRRVLYAL